jgi:hypothetical protein
MPGTKPARLNTPCSYTGIILFLHRYTAILPWDWPTEGRPVECQLSGKRPRCGPRKGYPFRKDIRFRKEGIDSIVLAKAARVIHRNESTGDPYLAFAKQAGADALSKSGCHLDAK